jgi:hypothetical protein
MRIDIVCISIHIQPINLCISVSLYHGLVVTTGSHKNNMHDAAVVCIMILDHLFVYGISL